jgi:hypothetical protein
VATVAESVEAERWIPVQADGLADAIAAGRADGSWGVDEGAPFVVAEADQQMWRFDCFDRLDEEFDGANEELGDGDGDPPSIDAGIATAKGGIDSGLLKRLEATLADWVAENGKATAWSLLFKAYHDVPATAAWHEREQASGGVA